MAELRAYLQYLYPQHLVSAIVFRLMRLEIAWLKNATIRWFIRKYAVDMASAAEPEPEAYPCFNDFFTRALRPDARRWRNDHDAIIAPADGFLSQIGALDGERLLQAKGHTFGATALLGGDAGWAGRFAGGRFATLYLSPRDYHRVHMPMSAALAEMVYVPGRLFSVNEATARVVPGLFARNERVACLFESESGPLAVVMVGAICVGCIETTWHGVVTPPRRARVERWRYEKPPALRMGEEMARFNMGSTVIVLLPADGAHWLPDWRPGSPVRVGDVLGRWRTPGERTHRGGG